MPGWWDTILGVGGDIIGSAVGSQIGEWFGRSQTQRQADPNLIDRLFGWDAGQPIALPTAGAGSPASPPVTPPARIIGGGGGGGGGASSMWDSPDAQFEFPLTVSRPRGLIPYSGGMVPTGYRVSHRAARRPTSGYPAGTYLVPRRRMNPLNPRALVRAERRMSAFSGWVKRHFQIQKNMPRRKRKKRCR